jgi:hypothetical protein
MTVNRRPTISGPPSGTVTFLFADIEGSTRLWEQYPDAMPKALAQHDELLRAAVQSCGGHVVKTPGDSLFAVFGRADSALAAALSAQNSSAAARSTAHAPEDLLKSAEQAFVAALHPDQLTQLKARGAAMDWPSAMAYLHSEVGRVVADSAQANGSARSLNLA